MFQEIFGGSLIGPPESDSVRLMRSDARARRDRGWVCRILSLFNIARPVFSGPRCPTSIGRKNTYYTFFVLGIALYALSPLFAQIGSKALFRATAAFAHLRGRATRGRRETSEARRRACRNDVPG